MLRPNGKYRRYCYSFIAFRSGSALQEETDGGMRTGFRTRTFVMPQIAAFNSVKEKHHNNNSKLSAALGVRNPSRTTDAQAPATSLLCADCQKLNATGK